MRLAWFKQWAIFSAPLLVILGTIRFAFPTENAVADFFKTHSQSNADITLLLKFITDWSNPVFYAVYGVMLILAFRNGDFEKRRFIFILLGVQVLVSVLCVHFTKHVIGRPRPGQGWYFDPLTTRGNYHSFPSGHTTEITGWSLPLALRFERTLLTVGLGLLIAIVGFSRIYLGWHHPSDVFFGWLLGSFGGFVTMVLAQSGLFRKKA